MSRLRTLKPGFFVDEDLAECSPLARLLFAGLWTIADRDGRLEDRPKRIKVQTLPYDECDVDTLLWELAGHGFIIRYEVSGDRFIAVPTWHKHQSPHVNEAASTIPAPEEHGASTVQAPKQHSPSCLGSCLGSGILEQDNGVQEEHLPSTATEDVAVVCAEDFEQWWTTFGKLGSKADARELYRWWRAHGADREQLLAAAVAYRAHCSATDCKMQHARTFLAKKPDRWREWATGEDHGTMDVTSAARVNDIAAAMLLPGGLLEGRHGRSRYPGNGGRPAGVAAGGTDARRGLPTGELADGE